MRTAEGWTLMPTPRLVSFPAASKMCMSVSPEACRARAVLNPPIPPPAMSTLGCDDMYGMASGVLCLQGGERG